MKKTLSFVLALTVLLSACQTGKSHFSKGDIFYLVEIGDLDGLKARNTDELSSRNTEGLTLLHVALMYNRAEIAEYLISQGADIEALDNYARTPLLLGTYNDSFEAMQVLIPHGAKIFASDYDGNTPFTYAVKNKTYKQLLSSSNVMQKDAEGLLPIDHARKLNNQDLIDYIVSLMPQKEPEVIEVPKKQAIDPDNPYATKESTANTVEHLLSGGKPYGAAYTEFEIAVLKRNFSMRFTDGNTPLHYAAKRGQNGILEFLISKGVAVNVKNLSNATPLHEAVRNGHLEAARLLLNANADPNSCDANGNTPLHVVMPEASRGALIDELLKHGANVNAQDDYGEAPIHIAARIGMSEEIIRKLVAAGADPNQRNKKGQTPLMLAVERNQLEQAKIFIDMGANIHDQDNEGVSSFSRGIDIGLPAVELMVNKKNINVRDSLGRTPLHIATFKNADSKIINYLLQEGAEVNTRDKDGNSPLHVAVEHNYKAIGTILISHGADIFITNKAGNSPLKVSYSLNEGREDWLITDTTIRSTDATGNTPLHLAAEWNNPNMIKYLLDKGANINAKNDTGETPFFSSMKGNSPACIDALLQYPASHIDINARDFLGNCVLHTAVQWLAYDAAMKVISMTNGSSLTYARNLAGKTPLHVAASQGSLRFIQMLLQYGVDVNESDELGQTALVYAINGNKVEAVKYLLQESASPSQQDSYGKTPLHCAVENKNIECVKVLRSAGAKIMTKDMNGATPLTLAFQQNTDMIAAVIADEKNIQDSDGQSPLHIAVIENIAPDTFAFLLNKGFYLNKRNKNGSSCLLLAVQLQRSELISALLAHHADAFIANNIGQSPLSLVLSERTEYLEKFSAALKDGGDSMGDTILHYAARLSTVDTVQKLLSLGHNPTLKNLEEQTPIDIARRWGKRDVVSVFENFNASESATPADTVEEKLPAPEAIESSELPEPSIEAAEE